MIEHYNLINQAVLWVAGIATAGFAVYLMWMPKPPKRKGRR